MRKEVITNSYLDFNDLKLFPIKENEKFKIRDYQDYIDLDRRIKIRMSHYRLDAILPGIKGENQNREQFHFLPGLLAHYALLESNMVLGWKQVFDVEVHILMEMVLSFISYDSDFSLKDKEQRKEKIIEAKKLILRKMGSQQIFDLPIQNVLGQTYSLFFDIPKNTLEKNLIKELVENKFQDDFGISLIDFFKIGLLLFTASIRGSAFSRQDLHNAKVLDKSIPDDQSINSILEFFTITRSQFLKERDRNEIVNPFEQNFLFDHPVIRFWNHGKELPPEEDLLISPIPRLIIYRLSTGLYFQLESKYKKRFTESFGRVFEQYINQIFNWYELDYPMITENEIYESYKHYPNKRPDFILFHKKGIILVECKAAIYTSKMFEEGDFSRNAVTTIKDALWKFKEIEALLPAIIADNKITTNPNNVQRVIVTYGMYIGLKRGMPLRETIDLELDGYGFSDDWKVVGVWELEDIQPSITAGMDLLEYISKYGSKEHTSVIDKMKKNTGKKYTDGIICENQNKLISTVLNLPDDFNQNPK